MTMKTAVLLADQVQFLVDQVADKTFVRTAPDIANR